MDTEEKIWMYGIATYGVGDLVTTSFGLTVSGVEEAHPVSDEILSSSGLGGMVGTKVLSIAGLMAIYSVSPEEYRAGVPIGLAVLGSGIVANNTSVIYRAMG